MKWNQTAWRRHAATLPHFLTPLLKGLGRSERRAGAALYVQGLLLPGQREHRQRVSPRIVTLFDLQQPNASAWVQNYTYDMAARMTGITSPAGTFAYTYDLGLAGTTAASSLIANIALPNGAFITNTYDSNGRMLGTWLTNSAGSNFDSSVYTYNVANQRTQVTRTGENTAAYTYDLIGQVVGDVASEGTTNRMNEQLHYAFDPVGNLNYRTNNTLIENFQVNSVNELTANTNGGKLTVMGTTTSLATNVTVNGTTAAHYGDATFAATNMPLTTTYTAIASDKYARYSTNTVTVSIATNTAYQYDGNGNLTNDGLRSFAYDNENQLLQVWVPNQWFSQFAYDGKMRRRIRQEYTWQSGAWVQTNEVYYVYDGNVVIQERNINNLPTTTYTRGPDLSASLEGAGGIGGLLAMTLNTAPGPSGSNSMYYHSDGNGNVTMLINPSQYVVAKYLYDAFGNILSAAGSLAQANLYRFSSKEAHPNSGLVYYLYRFYDPNLQRWANRDPIGELGGLNVYSCVFNSLINALDLFGLKPDLNLFPTNSTQYTNANSIPSSSNTFCIVGHCYNNLILNSNLAPISPQQLVNLITNNSNYSPQKQIQLLVCNGGAGGSNCPAQQILNLLPFGTTASSPSNFIWFPGTGAIGPPGWFTGPEMPGFPGFPWNGHLSPPGQGLKPFPNNPNPTK